MHLESRSNYTHLHTRSYYTLSIHLLGIPLLTKRKTLNWQTAARVNPQKCPQQLARPLKGSPCLHGNRGISCHVHSWWGVVVHDWQCGGEYTLVLSLLLPTYDTDYVHWLWEGSQGYSLQILPYNTVAPNAKMNLQPIVYACVELKIMLVVQGIKSTLT